MFSDYFSLAFTKLLKRGARSWLTLIGIVIGISALVALISLGQGLQEAITGQFSSLSIDRLIIQNSGSSFGPPGASSIKKLTNHDIDLIKEIKGINLVVPRIIRAAKVEYNKKANFEFIGSLPKKQEEVDFIYKTFKLEIEEGKLVSAGERKKILLGSNFKSDNNYGKEIRAGSLLKIQGKDFEVAGILKKTGSFQFNRVILMPERDMEDIFSFKEEFDFVVVLVKEKNKIESIADEIKRKFRKDRKQELGEEDFSVETPIQAIGVVNTILNIINLIVSGIAAISILVGGIGIANTMFTSVLERTREIGTMKAVGAKNSDILLIFLIESGLLGLTGGILGIALGLALAFLSSFLINIYFSTEIIKINISLLLLIFAASFAFFSGIIAGLIPAIQASKLNPVEALRA